MGTVRVKTIIAHIRLFRPLNLLTGAFSVYVSSAILRSLYQTSELTFAILTVVCYNAASNSLNDFIDFPRFSMINVPLSLLGDIYIAIVSSRRLARPPGPRPRRLMPKLMPQHASSVVPSH